MTLNGEELQLKLQEGVDLISDAVKVTLGPKGRNVILYNGEGKAYLTKDGISVASRVYSEDPTVNAAIQILREASEKTAVDGGDGTTSSIVLAQALYNAGIEALSLKRNIVDIRDEFSKAREKILTELKKQSVQLEFNHENAKHIAYISANNDEKVASLVADAYAGVGKDGTVVVEKVDEAFSKVDIIDGSRYRIGIASKDFFSTRKRNEAVLDDCYVLLYNNTIKSIDEIRKALVRPVEDKKPIAIFADDFTEVALSQLYQNYVKGILDVIPIKTVGSDFHKKDLYRDLAALTGASVYESAQTLGINLGRADTVRSTLIDTVIYNRNPRKQYLEYIKDLEDNLSGEMIPALKELVRQRLANLKGRIATIYVGGITAVEQKEKFDRIEDAVCAVRAAFEEGVCDGGGSTLVRISRKIKECPIVSAALCAPIYQLSINSYGENDLSIMSKVTDKLGWNFLTDKLEDLSKSGVIDPVKVVRLSVENAMSVALQLLTTEAIVC